MSALLDRAAQFGAAVRFGLLEQGATLRAAAVDTTERAVRAVVDAVPVGTYSLAFVRERQRVGFLWSREPKAAKPSRFLAPMRSTVLPARRVTFVATICQCRCRIVGLVPPVSVQHLALRDVIGGRVSLVMAVPWTADTVGLRWSLFSEDRVRSEIVVPGEQMALAVENLSDDDLVLEGAAFVVDSALEEGR